MALRLGVWAPVWGTFIVQQEPPEAVREATFEHNLRYIQRAEELGFASTLLLDRSLNSIKGPGAPILEAWVTAAALAPLTRRIELIVAARSAYRHPALAAQMGANIDRISGGRFAINIVSGWWQHEHDMAGIPFPASIWGKIKTTIQNVTVGTALGYATWFPGARWTELLTIGLMWATLVATVMSGVTYVLSARKFLGSERI